MITKPPPASATEFQERFVLRRQAERYRDRYHTGKRAVTDQNEKAALGRLLGRLGPLEVALDLPCGTGRLSSVLLEHTTRAILADISPAMIEVAREDLAGKPCTFLVADAIRTGLPDQACDVSLCHRYLQHIHEPGVRLAALSELRRVTRRYVIVSFYNPGPHSYRHWTLRMLTGRARWADHPPTTRTVQREFAAAGLKLVDTEKLRPAPFSGSYFCLAPI